MARPTGFLRGVFEDDDVATAIQKYESRYGGSALGGEDLRKSEYGTFVKLYFDLVTDFLRVRMGQAPTLCYARAERELRGVARPP